MTKPSYEELRKRYEAMKPPDLSPRASGAMWDAPQVVTLTLSYCACGMAKWNESEKCDRCVVLALLTEVEKSERELKKTSWMRGMISSQALTIRQQNSELSRVRGLLQRQWVSVEERLPEQGLHVLGYYRGDRNYREIVMCWSNGKRGGWTVDRPEAKWKHPTITHWMPWPAPPTFPQSSSLVSQGAESADIGKLDAADKSGMEKKADV